MNYRILSTVLLLLLASAIAACGSAGPADNAASHSSSNLIAEPGTNTVSDDKTGTAIAHNTNGAPAVPEGPAVSLTAEDLGNEYQRDPAAFDKKYKGSTLMVTGKAILAGQIGKTTANFAIILGALEGESNPKSVNIDCSTIADDQTATLGKAVNDVSQKIKDANVNVKGIKYPAATVKGSYDSSPAGETHGDTIPMIVLKPCKLVAVEMVN